MHFIGMLAFTLPIPMGYDIWITLLSLLIVVGLSVLALKLVMVPRLGARRLVGGATLLGIGIASMHYIDMAAMLMEPGISYDALLFATSVLIAIIGSGVVLYIFHVLCERGSFMAKYRLAAAAVMGFTVVGAHYTGMAAAHFANNSVCLAVSKGVPSAGWLAMAVAVVTLLILTLALVMAVFDSRMEERTTLLVQANQELTELALTDSLTQLPNRRLLEDRLNQAIIRSRRENTGFALIFMDLDGFKPINDTHGHHVGDDLLRYVAERLRSLLRAQDTVARMGGDEFVMLLEHADVAGIEAIAEKIVTRVGMDYRIKQHNMHVAASLGIVMFPDDGNDVRTLMGKADAAMYQAKQKGGGCYVFAGEAA
jgi:diguanylate cyclase (GGDEF)-like protein